MAYSFNLLTAEFSAAHTSAVEEFEAKVADGWASWSVGNHDSVRVMTRWGGENPSPCWPRWCWPCRRH
jgi:alpha-glucosidase